MGGRKPSYLTADFSIWKLSATCVGSVPVVWTKHHSYWCLPPTQRWLSGGTTMTRLCELHLKTLLLTYICIMGRASYRILQIETNYHIDILVPAYNLRSFILEDCEGRPPLLKKFNQQIMCAFHKMENIHDPLPIYWYIRLHPVLMDIDPFLTLPRLSSLGIMTSKTARSGRMQTANA